MEPSLDELLQTHSAKLQAMRASSKLAAKLTECDVGTELDELWLLRFLLSHNGDVEEACTAAEKTLAWREENAEMLKAARCSVSPGEWYEIVRQYVVADFHDKTTKDDEPFYIIRAGISNSVEVMNQVSHENMVRYLLYKREQMFQRADAATRQHQRLVRVIGCNDLANVSIMNGPGDRRFMKALTEASKIAEDVFPQLMGRAVIINLPSFFSSLFVLFKSLLPKRMQAKMAVCPGNTKDGDVSKCPFIRAKFALEDLPTFLGGKCRCHRGCVGIVPNEQCTMVGAKGEDGAMSTTVGARDKHTEVLAVEAGDMVLWQLRVAERGVDLSASLQLDSGEQVEQVAKRKVKSDMGEVSGSFQVKQRGAISFQFDNSYSLLNSKTVHFKLKVLSEADLKQPVA